MSSPSRKPKLWVPHSFRLYRKGWGIAQSATAPAHLKKAAVAGTLCLCLAASAHALPTWLQHIIANSPFESALYRTMHLPNADALYPRPPKEAEAELAKLQESAELHALKARTEESALDQPAAEQDWKLYAVQSKAPNARLELANYYHRQLQIPQEVAVLRDVAASAPIPTEALLDPGHQQSWQASLRILSLVAEDALPTAEAEKTYDALLTRYPGQPAAYARAFQFQLDQKNYPAAEALIARYKQHFAQDQTFPIRARALLDYRRGNAEKALAVYDQAFQPLWPNDLTASYFALLTETHRQRLFVADARARLAAHPDGPEALNALARIFQFDQQQGRTPQAQQTLDAFRVAREARAGQWTPEDLQTLAALELSTQNYAEAARYDFALSSLPGTLPSGETAAQQGLAALTRILLTASSADACTPLAVVSQNLSLYRDIATLDQGPGYWNGILSLWLNGTRPANEYAAETQKAQSYFQRSKAAELLAEIDRRFPAAPERPALHAAMLHALAAYGDPAAVVAAGKQYLVDFPQADARVEIAGLLADAYARQKDTKSEFALYDQQLAELAARTQGQPLSAAATQTQADDPNRIPNPQPDSMIRVAEDDVEEATPAAAPKSQAYSLDAYTTHRPLNPAADQYAQVLDRYLGRLTASGQIPAALAVLRRQLDRSPDDPALYEKLAAYLQQNNLTADQEAVYKQAIARFPATTGPTGWYDKLARFYLRQQNAQAFAALTRQVTDIFSGTDLDSYFAKVGTLATPDNGGAQIALQLNLYAAKRFPHDEVFVDNLLLAYKARPTADPMAYEALLRKHWWQTPDLTNRFFAYLSETNKLQSEITALGAPGLASETWVPTAAQAAANPAALRETAELNLWTSHYESAAPILSALADLYPADPTLDDRAVSIFRSLAYLDTTPASTLRAVAIETNLLKASPDDPERLATLGDLYAEATSTGGEDLAQAAPYWHRIPQLHPGTPAGYLTSATIFWDYFQFDDALHELTEARTRFAQPSLFGYEAGAIQENRHDLPAAIAEYTAVASTPPELATRFQSFVALAQAFFKPPSDAGDSAFKSTAQSFFGTEAAHDRLLQLARRPASKPLVDEATAKAVANAPTDLTTLTLRADVLTALHRERELPALFTGALAKATTAEQAAAIGTLAQTNTLPLVYEAALSRQAALTADPIERIGLQYALATSLEARKQNPEAAKIYAAVYAANPRILGVVRATTDFYARTGQPKASVTTLLEAAKAATPRLAHDFTLEAATRANDAGDPAQARALGLTLLPATPYDPQILAVIAASYAQANDNAGLKQFYLAQLEKARTDPALSRDDRKADIALLRRGLIPALTRMQDYEGATNQYIALLSAFPEDSGTAAQAALYALRYKRQAQLTGFLQTSVKESPKDSRFAVLLAQTDTTFEDLPGALTAYNAAIAIRKDRADLYQQRVELELRLGKFEEAAADYTKLYLLTYKDPQWMVQLAQLRARQQRPADAVKALTTAFIEGRPRSAENYFTAANYLEQWNLLPEAQTLAQQGITAAGATLLTTPAQSSGPQIYARILTRQGSAPQALATLTAARKSAQQIIATPAGLAAEFKRYTASQSGTDADADAETPDPADAAGSAAELRQNFAKQRRELIQTRFTTALAAIGTAIQTFDTPEQKQTYALSLDALHATDPQLAINAAAAAGLADREADWRKLQLLSGGADAQAQNLAPYTNLQQKRLLYAEEAPVLEQYAARQKPEKRNATLEQAAEAWHNAGTPAAEANELRLAHTLVRAADNRDYYLGLLLRKDPAAFTALAAGRENALPDAAVAYALAHGTLAQTKAVIDVRSRSLPAVWPKATFALAGLYLDPRNPAPHEAFAAALRSSDTIAERLGKPADPTQTLTGDLWFPFAARYGIALGATPEAEDVLAANLELDPTRPAGYIDLARTYAEAGNLPAALAEYAHALELAPTAPTIHDEIALLQYRSSHKDQALEEWRIALGLLRRTVERNAYSEAFYTTFAQILRHLGERHLTATLRPEIEAILRPELAKNGTYRSNELLKAVYVGSATPADGIQTLLAICNSAMNADSVLSDLEDAPWLAVDSRTLVFERRLEILRTAPANDQNAYEAHRLPVKLLQAYLSSGQDAKAQKLLDSIPADHQNDPDFTLDRILLAANAGRLPALLATYAAALDSGPNAAPTFDILASAANTLAGQARPGQTSARQLREYVFDQKQLLNSLLPTDFLSLAQSRIDTDDLPSALDLLKRLAQRATTVPASPDSVADTPATTDPNPYANTDSAAALLEAAHRPAEAIPFLQTLTQSVPWNATYRLRLAQAQLAAATDKPAAQAALIAVAKDATAPYDTRMQAAKLAQSVSPGDLGSAELNLLAAPNPTPAAARQPYFVEARLAAAAQASSADRAALLREAIAIAPTGNSSAQARLTLLQLELPNPDPAFALAVLGSLGNSQAASAPSADAPDTPATAATDPDDEDAPPADPDANADDPAPAALPAAARTLDLPATIRLAQAISLAQQRNDDLRAALSYALLAAFYDPAQTPRATELRAQLRLRRRNLLRLPDLGPDLHPPTAARPRLTLAQLQAEEIR